MIEKSFKNIIGISVILAIAFTLTGCSNSESKMTVQLLKPEEKKFQTYVVKKGSIKYEHNSSGKITARESVNVNASVPNGILEKLYVSTGAKVKKGDIIGKYYTRDIDNRIQTQEIQVQECETELKMIKNENSDPFKIEKAEFALKKEEVILQQLREQKETHIFRSPINGIVTTLTKAERGKTIDINEVIATIIDTESLLVFAEPDPINLAKYTPGMKAEIQYKDVSYPAIVKQVRVRQGMGVLLEFKDQMPKDAKFDEQVNYKIFGDEKEDVIVIPVSYLKTDDTGKKCVCVIKDGIREMKVIADGVSDGKMVEVKSGLELNETIIQK